MRLRLPYFPAVFACFRSGFLPRLVGLFACFLVNGALSGCRHFSVSADNHSLAVQGQRWETALTPEKSRPSSYATIEVDVTFSGPEGRTFRVPAFWDGDRGFVVRAAFPVTGSWRWASTCSDLTDAGLHERSGEIRVTAYTGKNPLYRHGDLRVSENRRHLVHADGTPFLWMGDTAWNAFWKATPGEWREYVDLRAGQGFSVIQVITAAAVPRREAEKLPAIGHAPFLADGTPNPVYWREADAKVAYANQRGLVVMLTGLGKSRANFSEQQGTPAFARYVAGRFAGDAVILSPSMDQRIDELNELVAGRLRGLSTHLVAQHPGTHRPTAQRYHDADYAHFSGLQTGHHQGDLAKVYEAAAVWTHELWQREPRKPVINLEAMYDGYGHDRGPAWRERDVRALGWISWLSGSCGYTYGAGDVPPKVPGASGGVWVFQQDPAAYDHWRKAAQWPSAGQMTLLRDFFAGVAWWRLEPAPELVRNQPAGPTQRIAVARSKVGDLVVAYLPDNAEITLDMTSLPGLRTGEWFNPVTGEYLPIAERADRSPTWTLRRPAGWLDAALKFE